MKFPTVNGPLDSWHSFIDVLLAYDNEKMSRPLIDFNPTLSSFKVYTANVLISLLSVIEPTGVAYYDECGKEAKELRVKFTRREFFTRINGAVVWKMIGFEGSKPILVFNKRSLNYGLYFDKRIFIGTRTGTRDYLPGASIIIRNLSLSSPRFSRVPFSWGSDIVPIDFHERLLFILETAPGRISGYSRKYLPGFKYLRTKNKFLVSYKKIPASEKRTILANGFEVSDNIRTGVEFKAFLLPKLRAYFGQQYELFKHTPARKARDAFQSAVIKHS